MEARTGGGAAFKPSVAVLQKRNKRHDYPSVDRKHLANADIPRVYLFFFKVGAHLPNQ